MRITQSSMYYNFVNGMNNTLSNYMETNVQSASQKKINRPSDDPVGLARVLTYRAAIERNKQYESNSQDVASYLGSTDSALTQAQVILEGLYGKAHQAATGTLTSENRLQIAEQVRQYFNQLVSLSNTAFSGQHLFAGHRTEAPAYQVGLGITTKDPNLLEAERVDGAVNQVPWEVSGSLSRTAMVRFDSVNGVIGAGVNGRIGVDTIEYSYSKDGGETWISKTLNSGEYALDLDGATITMPAPGTQPADLLNPVTITTYDPNEATGFNNGTMLYVRPTAYYQGDTNDPPPIVDMYGTSKIQNAEAHGTFKKDIRIRLDSEGDVASNGKVNYSYSLDNGITWTQATAADTYAGGDFVRLHVPDGYVDVYPEANEMLGEGQQFVVRPRRAELGLEIASGEFMNVTNCGKDIFGGLYVAPGETIAQPAKTEGKNIFEVISNLIGWLETGSQTGVQETYAELEQAQKDLVTDIARVGGKVNRVQLNVTMLQTHRDDNTSRMSKIQDVDYTELLTKLTQQQMAYQTVLQSSSMIMNMNLANYI